jgi:hypothetical protein
MTDPTPFGYVIHKDGKFGGVISSSCSRKDIAKFCGDAIADGYTVTKVSDRAAYLALLDQLDRPAPATPPAQSELFEAT